MRKPETARTAGSCGFARRSWSVVHFSCFVLVGTPTLGNRLKFHPSPLGGVLRSTLSEKAHTAAHRGERWRLHLHLRCLRLFLPKLLDIITECHIVLILAKLVHFAEKDIFLCGIELVRKFFFAAISFTERYI